MTATGDVAATSALPTASLASEPAVTDASGPAAEPLDTPTSTDTTPTTAAPPPPPQPSQPATVTCTPDASLPAPVTATVVGGLATTETTVVGATGQTLPADPAQTVGSTAGCSSAGAGAAAANSPAPQLPPIGWPFILLGGAW